MKFNAKQTFQTLIKNLNKQNHMLIRLLKRIVIKTVLFYVHLQLFDS